MKLLFLLSFSALVSFFQGDFLVPDLPQMPPQKTSDASLCLGVAVRVKVFLEGPYAGSNRMNDRLRTNNGAATNGSQCLIPATQPYSSLSGFTHTGSESVAPSLIPGDPPPVFAVTDVDNAIVDWIFLEIRDKDVPSTVIATRAALLQRDGDVVDVDGTSDVSFTTVNCGDYHVAVRHRNHLGVRTLNAVTLNGIGTGSIIPVDFTSTTFPNVYGTNALKTLTGSFTGAVAMYAGDANRSGSISASDRSLHWFIQNGQSIVLSPPSTYSYLTLTADFNLNGSVSASDRSLFWFINNGVSQQL